MTPRRMAAIHDAAMQVPRPWSEAEFAALLTDPGTLVATAGASFALGRVVLNEAELLTLATDPGHRRRGLARTALMRFHAAVATAGARRVILEVAQTNAPARALYAAAGYVQTGQRPRYYAFPGAAPVDALVLTLSLGPASGMTPE